MKFASFKYFPILFVVFFLFGCKNHSGNATGKDADTDPVFTENPRLKSITEQINSSPKDASLYFERGGVLHKLKLDTLAIKDFKRAASLDTTQAKYYSAVGDVLFEHKDLNGSIEWIQKAIAKDPTDQKAHLKIAKLFLYMKNYQQAFAEINIVMRKNVYDPEAYFLKGMIYKDMKDTAKAISSFQTAKQVAPDYRDAYIQLGLLGSAQKDPLAIKYLDDAYNMDSTDVFPLYAKAMYYQNVKDYVLAKEMYRKCILRNTHYVDAYFNLGYIYMQQDSVEKSFRQYDIVTKIDPLNAPAYFNRGVCNEMMNKPKDAVADYRQARSLDTAYKSPREALKRMGAQ